MSDDEQIVFVDEHGQPTGEVGAKLASHTDATKLHLAFSRYVFNDEGKVLVTKRAATKKVWPSVWTNSFCGHPAPGELMLAAIERRAQDELGTSITAITCILPDFRYQTPAYSGIVENEFCPVYVAKTSDRITPNPSEVADFYWASWADFAAKMEQNPDSFSYWTKKQYPLLTSSPTFNMFLASISQTKK